MRRTTGTPSGTKLNNNDAIGTPAQRTIDGWILRPLVIARIALCTDLRSNSFIMRPYALLATAVLFVCPVVHAIAQANAGPDQEVCGISTTLQGNPPIPGDSGFWTLVSGNATFTDATDALTAVTDLNYGENVLQWNYTDGFGTITTDQVSMWAFDPLAPAASAGPDQTIVGPPFTAQLSGSACLEPCFCVWTAVQGSFVISDPTDPNAIVTGLAVGTNLLNWTCTNGPCGASSDLVTINAFTWTGWDDHARSKAPFISYDPEYAILFINGSQHLGSLNVIDAMGRPTMNLNAGVTSWSVGDLSDGVYFVRAVIDGVVCTQRFVVSR